MRGKGGSYTEPCLLLPPSKTHVALAAHWSPMRACDCPEQTRHARLKNCQEFSWNSASSHRWPTTLKGWPESTGSQGAVTSEGPWASTPMTKAEPQRAILLDTSDEAPPALFLLKQCTARSELWGNLLRAAFGYQEEARLYSISGKCPGWWSLEGHYLVGQTATTTMATSSSKITIIIPEKQKRTRPPVMLSTSRASPLPSSIF